ncbi:NitT/TauT family transport system ATP-binding protein [Paenibacillus cellulosilyticus]|uniref:NitT/TauT family transport system ATP-binding protein n=1 Tax=Paenibacillus cellulosilyticus TaxID=375489 RepID=A0A2V2YSP7_9BACL|nr:ABC transporter ATP-binding protein [Paenibacillus cellulosilyticus]PWW00651.1 NitT/TauT family transport system ATP-binding protein [Paenibacillus cellulosilyticus]QKS45517.1 ABC transporter ATP-binding protein [Paenibacillus cellulosilyticus]
MPDHGKLRLHNVTHVYVNDGGASLAVDSFNLTVGQGEFVSLVGPSGCGKTTVLHLIAGLLRPTRGEVTIGGAAVTGPTASVGYMLQQDYLFPWRNIQDNASIGLAINGKLTPDAKSRVRGLLQELELSGTELRYPHELSGGMRQRVALARTLATEPDVMLLDEPFSALDMHIKLQLEDLVWDTIRRRGQTAVLVTHDLAEAAAMSDRIIVLGRNPGRIRLTLDVPEELRRTSPMEARRHPSFQPLFEQLWEEMDVEEAASSSVDVRKERNGHHDEKV